ncbi:SRPBCC family protein [Nocardioides cavernaquae]|uniref:SRPBCC family protein n=1 Tax=Nocardioides cavernaquae TaxID=2321396 RepID=A0A3A5H416_9ACTN|nr:SRPBCC family protein [Nocardioides cavernaquae]RJS45486.1 SRPBCC family protein [Nocardioides cavernaquae]
MPRQGIAVEFAVPCAVARAYLSDPRNRPAWQSSLRAVADVVPGRDGEAGGVEATWTDVTVVPGIRPRMRTEYDDAQRWIESGAFGPFRATLELAFEPAAHGCVVTARFRVLGLGLGRLITVASIPAIRADLRRAAAILAR